MAKILTRCPVCEASLSVSELACGRCKTSIHGAFDTCRFCRLAPDHLAFVELFLRCEGNLSRVEKELGLSYPTVRNKLSAALSALGLTAEGNDPDSPPVTVEAATAAPPLPAPDPNAAERRREVLEALANGTMSAEDAALALRDLI